MSTPVLLVSGASGRLGRRVVELLLERKSGHVIAGTRDPAKLVDLAAKGAEVRALDFDRPETFATAFAGVERALIISTDRVDVRKQPQRAAVEAAAKAGVKHAVYTSALTPRPSETNAISDSHFWTEQALAASPMGWTVLRNGIYADTILFGLPNALKTGQMFSATGHAGRNYVTREDCAEVAAAALASGFDGCRILDVTGPRPVTHEQIAAWVSELSGRNVAHVPLPPDGLRHALLAAGLPRPYVEGLVGFDIDTAEGFHAITTPVVKDLTGRVPTGVEDFLRANVSAIRAAA
ncbi:MAG TPA: NAD(P)H-binding protein [Bauldia sp.]|nr:NAD(P)H-binding protein [Bauldia sp.]